MRDRTEEDFSDVITDLRFRNKKIVPVTNVAGVYHNPNSPEGFQYAAAFLTTDERGVTWVEVFGVKPLDTRMVITGRCNSVHLDPEDTEIKRHAAELIERWLGPRK
jgi:hypothetical protein